MKKRLHSILLSLFLLGCFSAIGQVLQMNIKSNNNRNAAGKAIVSLSDSSSIIAGYTYDLTGTTITNPNILLFQVQKDGTLLWQKEIAGMGSSNRNFPSRLKIAQNGDIILATHSHTATYDNYTNILYRFSPSGVLKWQKVIRFTDSMGAPLQCSGCYTTNPGDYIADFTELPDNRLVLVGTHKVTPGASASLIVMLSAAVASTAPNIQYIDIYNAASSDGFSGIVSKGYNCYITGQYYIGNGAANNDAVVWKYNAGTNSTDTSGTTVWRKVFNYSAINPATNAAINATNALGFIDLKDDKLIISGSSSNNFYASVSNSSEMVKIDTNGNNIDIVQYARNGSYANSPLLIPIGQNNVLNVQSPSNQLFDMSTLRIGSGSIVPNTVLTRVDLGNGNKVSREINLSGNQSLYDAYSQGNILDVVGCNDNDTFKDIYLFKTFINFENMNQNGCDLQHDSTTLINLNYTMVNEQYTRTVAHLYNNYNFTPTFSTPNLVPEVLCGSLCNFGVNISRTMTASDSLEANIIGTSINPTYLWNTGATTKKIKITSNGIYYVRVTDSLGCVVFFSFKVKTYVAPPCAQYKNFTWSNIGNHHTFYPSPNIPSSYFPDIVWTVSNGVTSTLAQPVFNLTPNNTFTVKYKYCLRDSNQNVICCDSVSKVVQTTGGNSGGGLPCNLVAKFGSYNVNSNGTVQFIDSSTPQTSQMYTYYWTFGDGISSTQKNPTHNYISNGTKNVCLIVRRWLNSNNMYCEDTICKTITVTNVNPCNRFLPDFTWNISSTGAYVFSNVTNMTNFNLVSINFTISNGASYNVNNASHRFTSNGNYGITMTITVYDVLSGTNCTKTITKYLYANTSICGCLDAYNYYTKTGMTVHFINASICTDSSTTYLYKFGNGDTAITPNPSYTYSLPGLYRTVMYITRTVGSTTCKDSFVRIIQITTNNPCKDSGYTTYYNYSCSPYISPVCGCDSITYQNSCFAGKVGVKQYRQGPCANDTNYVKICGYVYIDIDKDCQIDSFDVPRPNIPIKINTNPATYTYTNAAGYYQIYLPKGNYVLTQILTNSTLPLTQICPANPGTISVAATNGGTTYCNNNFFDTTNTCQDLATSIYRSWNITPGFTSKKTIKYQNNGATAISGVVLKYRFLSALSVKSSTSPTYSVSGNVISWNLGTIPAYSTGYKYAYFYTPTTLALGTTVIDSVWIEPLTGDCQPSNNSGIYIDTCVGSWDPNDKAAFPAGNIDTATKSIDYLVRFQNTGTAPAHNVLISDELDANFDRESLHINSSSHPQTSYFNENGKLYFEFSNIMLPDSGTDYEASQGYVSYSIKLKNNLPLGTQLRNTASVFFDFNAPVITNTTVNTLVLKSTTAVTSSDNNMQITLYPNPTQHTATIQLSLDQPSIIEYSLYDLNGKRIISKEPVQSRTNSFTDNLNLEALQSGIYILHISVNGKSTDFKLVKE